MAKDVESEKASAFQDPLSVLHSAGAAPWTWEGQASGTGISNGHDHEPTAASR